MTRTVWPSWRAAAATSASVSIAGPGSTRDGRAGRRLRGLTRTRLRCDVARRQRQGEGGGQGQADGAHAVPPGSAGGGAPLDADGRGARFLALDAERAAVARDDDVGDAEHPLPADLDRRLVVAVRVELGVRSACHHRWVMA